MKAFTLIAASLIMPLFLGQSSAVNGSNSELSPDCGVSSLYLLLKTQNIRIDMSDLKKSLPSQTSQGFSLRELIRASKTHGMKLDAVFLGKDPKLIDRPLIAYMKLQDHGHYLVIRPVGHSKSLVQVIDPFNEPEVVEVQDLVAFPTWTGIVLTPRTFAEELARPACSALLIISALFLIRFIIVRVRRRTGTKQIVVTI